MKLRITILADFALSVSGCGRTSQDLQDRASEASKTPRSRPSPSNGADALAPSKRVSHAELKSAISSGDAQKVRELAKAGVDVNQRVGRDMTPLHVAVALDQPEIIEVLLDSGANIDAATSLGMTPLLSSVFFKKEELATKLIARGANLDATNSAGATSLILAATNKMESLALELVNHGANVNLHTQGNKTTALMMASHNDLQKLAGELIVKGGDVAALDANGKTAHDYAKSVEMKKILADKDQGGEVSAP